MKKREKPLKKINPIEPEVETKDQRPEKPPGTKK